MDYIRKPVNSAELLARVSSALALRAERVMREGREQELLLRTQELEHALREVKVLRGFIPICANCKRVRTDTGDWQRLEDYIQKHSEAEFSHGICQRCTRKVYPEVCIDCFRWVKQLPRRSGKNLLASSGIPPSTYINSGPGKDGMAKILVIDDEEGIRNLLDTLLSRKGYNVVLADGGRKGLEFFRRECPNVIVLDLKMPEMDGMAVLQQIHNLNPGQPVIILTGAGLPEAEERLRAFRVSEYVEKEFSLHRLGDALKRALAASQSATLASASANTVTIKGT
jgi:DNA-binding response OmpR family regulator